jgi:hypothetical protein
MRQDEKTSKRATNCFGTPLEGTKNKSNIDVIVGNTLSERMNKRSIYMLCYISGRNFIEETVEPKL